MTVEEASEALRNHLKRDPNVQVIGIRGNNVEAYKANPGLFVSEIKEDSLVVYTYKKPTSKELELTEFQGYKVNWHRMGQLSLNCTN